MVEKQNVVIILEWLYGFRWLCADDDDSSKQELYDVCYVC